VTTATYISFNRKIQRKEATESFKNKTD